MAIYSTHIPEVPLLSDFNHFAWFCSLKKDNYDLLTLSKIEGTIPVLPKQFLPPTYAIEFVTKGTITGKINGKTVSLSPNTGVFWLSDHILKEVQTSPDCEIYVLGFTTQFAEMLNLNISQVQFSQLLMQPTWHLADNQMLIVLKYIELLRILIEADKFTEVLHLVRSMLYNLTEDYTLLYPQQTASLTRAEQICGQYLSLVEIHCRTQHTVKWYADQMHLSSKYLSNTVHQTLHTSPNAYIDMSLIRQAKSLLSSTSLSVQQIADRLGFQNQSHFGTFFKRQTGFNPSAFKNTSK